MQTKLIGLGIIVFLAAALFWQAEKQGQLRQQIKGHTSTIKAMAEYENKQIQQKARDDQLAAKNRTKHQLLARENNDLRKQLQNVSGCADERIDAVTVERVREFRSKNGIYPRAGSTVPN